VLLPKPGGQKIAWAFVGLSHPGLEFSSFSGGFVMSHEIDDTTGQPAVFVTGEPAWHRLGAVIETAASSAEAIKLARLDWRVEQWPIRAFGPEQPIGESGQTKAVDVSVADCVANVRTDTNAVLGVVGLRYRVFQNAEAFDFMDALVGEKLAMYETAGSLHGGRRVWMMARIPQEYRAGRDDLIKPYVLLTNTHDGSQSLRMFPTTVRVVCANTLNLALDEAGGEGLTVSHHPRLDSRIAEARTKLGIIAVRFAKFGEELHALAARQMSVSEAVAYFRSLAGMDIPGGTDRQRKTRENIYQQFLTNFDNARNALPGMKHTAWGAYNAVSEWADHQRNYRGLNPTEKLNRRLDSIWFGASHQLKQAAYYGALELATEDEPARDAAEDLLGVI
jgi:phage/plasmid-like protein (TIGR03299 family)